MIEQPKNSYLPRKTFFWIMGVMIAILVPMMGGLTTIVFNTQANFNHSFTEVKVDIGKIQTDLEWLINQLP